MTIVEAIKTVLYQVPDGLTSKEIYDEIVKQNLYSFGAKNPLGVVNSQIRRRCAGLDFPTAYPVKVYAVEISIFSISAADLESDRAGEPAKLLQQKYIEASASMSKGIPAVLLIDDIDTTLGEWENHTGTVNHQNILAFLMHIADNPHFIENVGSVNRVPIFFTGNNFDRLYKPLIREGRANRFDWEPTREEKISIVTSIFSLESCKVAEMLVDSYPSEKISFFTNLMVSKKIEQLSTLANNVIFKYLLTNDDYRKELYSRYCTMTKNIPWELVVRENLCKNAKKDFTAQPSVGLEGDSD